MWIRPAVQVVVAIVVGCALAGCGGSAGTSGSAKVSLLASDVQVSSASCTTLGVVNGKRVDSSFCVFVLSDGQRFRCPPSFSRATQSVVSLEHAKACTRLTPIAIPPAWRPGFAAIEKARSCLLSKGLRVLGGPNLGAPHRAPETPIGELIVINRNAPVLIGFYPSASAAQSFEATAVRNVKHTGGQAARRGDVIVVFTRHTPIQLRDATDACAFG